MKQTSKIILLVFIFLTSCTQQQDEKVVALPINEVPKPIFQIDTTVYCQDKYYNLAFNEINQMLEDKISLDFKRASFLVEWAYLKGNLDYTDFCKQIATISKGLKQFITDKKVGIYKTAGNYALYEYFTKPHPMNNYKPFVYDFDDFYGEKDYKSVFVTKLLKTHTGQCRSMPMLYKILAEEIGAESYLALAPNHLYIKHLDEQNKWVNIELTNGHFSSDSWMISSMDISAESIKNGVYMKHLTLKESIALCLLELAFAYQEQYNYDKFSILCCDKSLKKFPNLITALMHKSNTLRHLGLTYIKKYGKKKSPFIETNYKQFKTVQRQLDSLGYREMSKEGYEAWINSMEQEKLKRSTQNN
jgi:hypothetical protein